MPSPPRRPRETVRTPRWRFGLFDAIARRRRQRRLAAWLKARRTASGSSDSHAVEEPLAFWKRRSVVGILQGVAAEALVVAIGITGYVMLGWSAFDALYMVVITISGVGFGEVRPLVSVAERVHTMLIITFGMVTVGYTLARFIQFLTEGEIQNILGHRRMIGQIATLSGHTVVAGFGRVGALVCDELAAADLPFVVIETSLEKIPEIEGKGYLCVHGDATEEKILRSAGLERAETLVTVMPNDAANVYICLTARQMAHKVKIIARAEQPSTQKKLRQAGADHVILPALIGAHRIVSLLTNPSAVEFAELVTSRSSLAIEMDDVPIKEKSPLAGQTLRDADIGRLTGTIVIAVKRVDGRVEFPPTGEVPLVQGDSIVVLGRRSNLDQFRRLFEI